MNLLFNECCDYVEANSQPLRVKKELSFPPCVEYEYESVSKRLIRLGIYYGASCVYSTNVNEHGARDARICKTLAEFQVVFQAFISENRFGSQSLNTVVAED